MLTIIQQEECAMCDYSLHLTSSRPARVGDRLVTTTFANSITRGLAGVGEPNVAVCLLPGTEVAFEGLVEYDRVFGVLPKARSSERVARFRQVDKDHPDVHHDALEFPSGQLLMIHRLCPGQHLTVLQLPASTQADIDHGQRAPSWSGQDARDGASPRQVAVASGRDLSAPA